MRTKIFKLQRHQICEDNESMYVKVLCSVQNLSSKTEGCYYESQPALPNVSCTDHKARQHTHLSYESTAFSSFRTGPDVARYVPLGAFVQ